MTTNEPNRWLDSDAVRLIERITPSDKPESIGTAARIVVGAILALALLYILFPILDLPFTTR